MRRSTQMLILGLAIFVIGAGVVLVSLKGGGGDSGNKTALSTTTTTIQAGTVVVNSAAPTAPATFTIPDGKQAVAVQVPYVSGLAGYAKAGDMVNVYGNVEKGTGTLDPAPPATKLILSDVQVLAVTGPGPGADSGNATYLLALDASQAEQAIFFARFESLWLTLVPKGQAQSTTSGHSYKNAF
ncbi:MAG TPA: RcpC/CpaB family pilus assembly protein [Acidimicrobiia bacterium]|nr:RcpC/CpaB family pilus assembly protein [Acidimicrobiia bacterium]